MSIIIHVQKIISGIAFSSEKYQRKKNKVICIKKIIRTKTSY
jgi:hypothetical protein